MDERLRDARQTLRAEIAAARTVPALARAWRKLTRREARGELRRRQADALHEALHARLLVIFDPHPAAALAVHSGTGRATRTPAPQTGVRC